MSQGGSICVSECRSIAHLLTRVNLNLQKQALLLPLVLILRDCEIMFNAVSELLLIPRFFLLFSNSGTDYYDYAHGLSDDTYDSYSE